MRQVNFNLNGLIQNIRVNVGKKDKKTVEAVVERAVEKAVAESLLGKDAKLDTVEFHTQKGEAIVDSVSIIQPVQTSIVVDIDDDRNIFAGQDDADTAKLRGENAVFGTLLTKNVAASVTNVSTNEPEAIDKSSSGSKTNPFPTDTSFENLVENWQSFVDEHINDPDGGYQAKLDYMADIIAAAEDEAKAYAEEHGLNTAGHPPYPLEGDSPEMSQWLELKDQANTWRCYRFMLINNNVREQFRAYSIQQEYGLIDFDEIQFGDILATGTYPDIADFEEFNYFGGHSEGTENGPGYYVPNENNDLRYIYSMAMLTVYVTKANAAQLRLRDPSLSNPERNMIQRSLAYFRSMIANIQTALAEIKENIENEHHDDPGFALTDYLNLLIPGGLSPEMYTAPQLDDGPNRSHQIYWTNQAEYKQNPTQELAQQLYDYAAEQFKFETQWENTHPRYQWHLHDSLYWQAEMQHWQQILNSGNISRGGNGSSASLHRK